MNRRVKRDGNHKAMTAFLRSIHWPFRECGHFPGLGCDLITRHKDGFPIFLEIKREGPPSARKLTDSEAELQLFFPQFFRIAQTVEELAEAIGVGYVHTGIGM